MTTRSRFRTALSALVALAACAVVAAGCGDDSTTSSQGITVFAAASLTEAFTELGRAFEAANGDTDVTFSFGASSSLLQPIDDAAPADVYASADEANMEKLTAAGNARGEPAVFATNRLEIITAKGNPEGIISVSDLADPELIVVTAGPDVPIGRYTAEVFRKAGVTVTPKSYETDVKAVVTKVALGEADAGIVYATDVVAARDKATGVPIPDDLNVVARYPIAVTKAATNVDVAEAFVAFALSDEGRAILADFGFSRA